MIERLCRKRSSNASSPWTRLLCLDFTHGRHPHDSALRRRRVGKSAAVGVVLLLITVSCGRYGTRHPTPENIPEIHDERRILKIRPAGRITLADSADYDFIEIGRPPDDILADPVDAAVDFAGTLYVLDDGLSAVHAYNYEGERIARFGGPGAGPGLLFSPRSVSVADSGRSVVVTCRSTGQVDVFARQGNQFTLRSSFEGAKLIRTSCAMNGHVYVLGLVEGTDKAIHKYTLDGMRKRSFGDLYQAVSASAQHGLSYRGFLACNETENVVAYVRRYVPVITGFSTTGVVLWQVKADGYKPSRVVSWVDEKGRDIISYRGSLWGHHAFRHLKSGRGSKFYLHYVWRRDAGDQAMVARIDARTGYSAVIATEGIVPQVVDGDTLVTFRGMPSPRVRLWKRRTEDG